MVGRSILSSLVGLLLVSIKRRSMNRTRTMSTRKMTGTRTNKRRRHRIRDGRVRKPTSFSALFTCDKGSHQTRHSSFLTCEKVGTDPMWGWPVPSASRTLNDLPASIPAIATRLCPIVKESRVCFPKTRTKQECLLSFLITKQN